MQFGHALERIFCEILLANSANVHVQINKTDLSDGFYQVDINTNDVYKLGVVLFTKPGKKRIIALPLVFPMGWKNTPSAFSTATETAANLANQRLSRPEYHPPDHRLDQMAAEVPFTKSG